MPVCILRGMNMMPQYEPIELTREMADSRGAEPISIHCANRDGVKLVTTACNHRVLFQTAEERKRFVETSGWSFDSDNVRWICPVCKDGKKFSGRYMVGVDPRAGQ